MPTLPAGVVLSSKGRRFLGWLLEVVLIIVTLVIGWIIWSVVLWKYGESPAKSILKMRVVDAETGRAAPVGTMALRELVGKWLLNAIPLYTLIGAIFVITDARSQGLWDKIAKTIVVDDPDGLTK